MDTTKVIMGLVPFILMGAIVVLIMVMRSRGARNERDEIRYAPKRLMTEHETAFFTKLNQAAERIGAEGVFPQVAMEAVITVRSELEQSERRSARNAFDRKIIDFVLVDGDMEIMALVELDDRTHDSQSARIKDDKRDAITQEAGYVTVRFRNGHRTTTSQIETELRRALRR